MLVSGMDGIVKVMNSHQINFGNTHARYFPIE